MSNYGQDWLISQRCIGGHSNTSGVIALFHTGGLSGYPRQNRDLRVNTEQNSPGDIYAFGSSPELSYELPCYALPRAIGCISALLRSIIRDSVPRAWIINGAVLEYMNLWYPVGRLADLHLRAMDALTSYVQCSVHSRAEDCLEHALNREPDVLFQSNVG